MSTFVAIDFETATARRDSACAVGLAACCSGRVVLARTYLIRPPRPRFTFTRVHGLGWEDVEHAPDFAGLWPVLRAWIGGAAFLAAHNARFDRAVLQACCARYGLRPPRMSFTCTVQLARVQWGVHPTSLPEVCRRLRIPLRHHDAGSDALACARVVLAAEANGWRRGKRRKRRTHRASADAVPLVAAGPTAGVPLTAAPALPGRPPCPLQSELPSGPSGPHSSPTRPSDRSQQVSSVTLPRGEFGPGSSTESGTSPSRSR